MDRIGTKVPKVQPVANPPRLDQVISRVIDLQKKAGSSPAVGDAIGISMQHAPRMRIKHTESTKKKLSTKLEKGTLNKLFDETYSTIKTHRARKIDAIYEQRDQIRASGALIFPLAFVAVGIMGLAGAVSSTMPLLTGLGLIIVGGVMFIGICVFLYVMQQKLTEFVSQNDTLKEKIDSNIAVIAEKSHEKAHALEQELENTVNQCRQIEASLWHRR